MGQNYKGQPQEVHRHWRLSRRLNEVTNISPFVMYVYKLQSPERKELEQLTDNSLTEDRNIRKSLLVRHLLGVITSAIS